MNTILGMSVYLKNFKFPRVWKFIAFFQIITIYYLCLRGSLPSTPSLPHIDKLFHLAAYFFLSGYLFSILSSGHFWKQVISLLVMGYSIELLQALTETRSYELLDMLANAAGILLGPLVFKSLNLAPILKTIELKLS